ncbi:MAG: Rnf-Nqr domain containing protein, partial [Gammaproteobacteria bacterium]
LLRYFPLMARRHDFALLFFGGGSAVVGTSLLATTGSAHFAQAMAFSLGSAAGFCLLLVLVAAVRERLEAATIPDAFRGAPITLISAGIISLCLYTLQAG